VLENCRLRRATYSPVLKQIEKESSMKKKATSRRGNSSRGIRRFGLIAIIIAVVALGATAAISLRPGQAKDLKAKPASQLMSNKNSANLIRLAGQQNDAGQIRPLTQEEAQRLAEGIKELVNPSTEGLKTVRHPDGTITMDLDGRFQNVTLAKRTENGVAQTCVDNPEAAAEFFGIDPNLMKNPSDAKSSGSTLKPTGISGKGEIK
jgi:hypothetical protein